MRRAPSYLLGVVVTVFGMGVAWAADPVAPPAMYPPATWEGRSDAVLRVLDRLDSNVETLTITAGQSATFKSVTIAVQSCLQHPPGLPPDAAASLRITDAHSAASDFSGWMFAAEPFVAVFQSPVYGVQLVSCGGTAVAPAAPTLPPPAVPAPPANANAASPDAEPNPVYPSGGPDASAPPPQ